MSSEGGAPPTAIAKEPTASLESQYRAAMEGVVVIDRSHLARVEAVGREREEFLHNMLSADIKGLERSAGTRGTFLTAKGKLVSDLNVFNEGDRILLEMEATRVEALLRALSRYIISEDVTLRSLANEEVSFSVEGAEASALLSRLLGPSAEDLDALERFRTIEIEAARITAHGDIPSPRFDVAAPPPEARALAERAIAAGATLGGEELSETRRIEAGRPRFGVDMDESHMPMEAGLGDAINFDKGCYIGQEYVVRLAHRGHLNRKLVGVVVQCEDAPPKGTTIEVSGQPVGELTSAAYSPRFAAVVALGYVKKNFFDPGTKVSVLGQQGRVSSLPFSTS